LNLSLDKPAGLETHVNVLAPFNVQSEINAVLTPYTLTKHLRVLIHLNKAEKVTDALLDSGAMGNFIHKEVVKQLNLDRIP
jgi:hypothetical protein